MKGKLKSQKGVAFLAVILVMVIAVIAGGATYLGVRMLITGDSFLKPFEDLEWISSNDENSSDLGKQEEVINDSSKISTSVKKSRLSEDAKETDTVHYYGSMTLADSEEYDENDENAELYKLLTMEVNLYARNDKVVEIVFTINMKDYLEKAYELYKDEMSDAGYETYEEFEKDMIPVFESAFDFGYSQASNKNSEIYDYIKKYKDDAVIQVYITEKGFDALYEKYEISGDTNNINEIKDALKESIGVTLKKVK